MPELSRVTVRPVMLGYVVDPANSLQTIVLAVAALGVDEVDSIDTLEPNGRSHQLTKSQCLAGRSAAFRHTGGISTFCVHTDVSDSFRQQLVTCGEAIIIEHLHRIEAEIRQITTNSIQFGQKTVGDRYDMAADLIGMKNVQ